MKFWGGPFQSLCASRSHRQRQRVSAKVVIEGNDSVQNTIAMILLEGKC
ncbi:hypothetical protein [Faunimonas pinastri]|nr:hypothetical protein [Faunimonas pinastri]